MIEAQLWHGYDRADLDDQYRASGRRIRDPDAWLARWRADGELQPAAAFIEVVEQTGLIIEVGRWVLESACAQAVEWLAEQQMERFVVRVNLSARQLDRPALIDAERGHSPDRFSSRTTSSSAVWLKST